MKRDPVCTSLVMIMTLLCSFLWYVDRNEQYLRGQNDAIEDIQKKTRDHIDRHQRDMAETAEQLRHGQLVRLRYNSFVYTDSKGVKRWGIHMSTQSESELLGSITGLPPAGNTGKSEPEYSDWLKFSPALFDKTP